jgi:hypothetical protein
MYKTQFDQYIRVLKHGRMLALFDPVIGLVGFGHPLIEAKRTTVPQEGKYCDSSQKNSL